MTIKQNTRRGAVLASLLLLAALLPLSCNRKKPAAPQGQGIDYLAVQIPDFSADSAYRYVSDQLAFGFRTPGTKAQRDCAAYLQSKMRQWCDTVILQPFSTVLWNGQTVNGINIIASLDPDKSDRILLCAHWDSRLWADHDPDSLNHRKPIPGANDGASGVATLMEMARVISANRPSVGIDFIFFDVEDQGMPEWADEDYQDNTWCKGSQYWAQNPHRPYYRAIYGILFDMVGTTQPRFTKEEISRRYAPSLIDKVWRAAAAIGSASTFVDQPTDAILDDHLYVNQIANIPTIDIVQNNPDCSFFPLWHTLADNLDAIEPRSMKTVADVVMKTIYGDYGNK